VENGDYRIIANCVYNIQCWNNISNNVRLWLMNYEDMFECISGHLNAGHCMLINNSG